MRRRHWNKRIAVGCLLLGCGWTTGNEEDRLPFASYGLFSLLRDEATSVEEEDEKDLPPVRVRTDLGEFVVPRTFAVPVWRDLLRDLSFRSNYFVMQLPADFVAERVVGYAPRLNHFTQDVVVAVEALSPSRLVELWSVPAWMRCEISAHDLAPESVPYRRCEYRRLSNREFAVKFWLGGANNDLIDEVSALVLETAGSWLIAPAEGDRLAGEATP